MMTAVKIGQRVKTEKTFDRNDKVVLIGSLLKQQRKSLNLTQKDIRCRLNYQYVNFISMLETGSCKIPLNRIVPIVTAYSLEPDFILILTKHLHPDVWRLICDIKETNKAFSSGVSMTDVDKKIDTLLKAKLQQLKIAVHNQSKI